MDVAHHPLDCQTWPRSLRRPSRLGNTMTAATTPYYIRAVEPELKPVLKSEVEEEEP